MSKNCLLYAGEISKKVSVTTSLIIFLSLFATNRTDAITILWKNK